MVPAGPLALLATLPLLALTAPPATAAMPPLASQGSGALSLVELARSDCKWVDNKWTYQRGDKRLVCRPNRPTGKGWGWHQAAYDAPCNVA